MSYVSLASTTAHFTAKEVETVTALVQALCETDYPPKVVTATTRSIVPSWVCIKGTFATLGRLSALSSSQVSIVTSCVSSCLSLSRPVVPFYPFPVGNPFIVRTITRPQLASNPHPLPFLLSRPIFSVDFVRAPCDRYEAALDAARSTSLGVASIRERTQRLAGSSTEETMQQASRWCDCSTSFSPQEGDCA